MAAPAAQVARKPPVYNEREVADMAAYIASLAPGPAIPTAEQIDYTDADVAEGGVLFRINCAQCHQAAGGGGALTAGKYAPSLMIALGRIGPVAEGLFLWVGVIGAFIGLAVWIGIRAR